LHLLLHEARRADRMEGDESGNSAEHFLGFDYQEDAGVLPEFYQHLNLDLLAELLIL